MAVVLVQNGVHSLPKSHLMHDEVGSDVSSGPSFGHDDPVFAKPADEAKGPSRCKLGELATTPCRGLSRFRWAT